MSSDPGIPTNSKNDLITAFIHQKLAIACEEVISRKNVLKTWDELRSKKSYFINVFDSSQSNERTQASASISFTQGWELHRNDNFAF